MTLFAEQLFIISDWCPFFGCCSLSGTVFCGCFSWCSFLIDIWYTQRAKEALALGSKGMEFDLQVVLLDLIFA